MTTTIKTTAEDLARCEEIIRRDGVVRAWVARSGSGKAKSALAYHDRAEQPAVAAQRWDDLCHHVPQALCVSPKGEHYCAVSLKGEGRLVRVSTDTRRNNVAWCESEWMHEDVYVLLEWVPARREYVAIWERDW